MLAGSSHHDRFTDSFHSIMEAVMEEASLAVLTNDISDKFLVYNLAGSKLGVGVEH